VLPLRVESFFLVSSLIVCVKLQMAFKLDLYAYIKAVPILILYQYWCQYQQYHYSVVSEADVESYVVGVAHVTFSTWPDRQQ